MLEPPRWRSVTAPDRVLVVASKPHQLPPPPPPPPPPAPPPPPKPLEPEPPGVDAIAVDTVDENDDRSDESVAAVSAFMFPTYQPEVAAFRSSPAKARAHWSTQRYTMAYGRYSAK